MTQQLFLPLSVLTYSTLAALLLGLGGRRDLGLGLGGVF